jgi:hypothetical protein
MSDYIKDLIDKVNDHNKWPSFDRPDFLWELNELADNALKKNSLEGYLAALLIYHQLCEEIIRLLVVDAHFFIQLSVFPSEITFPQKKNPMFGQVLDELRSTVSFQEKDELIKKCEELNKLRIETVHHLTRQNSLKDIKSRLGKVRTLYDEIFELHQVAHDDWRVAFHGFKKDIEWDEYLK